MTGGLLYEALDLRKDYGRSWELKIPHLTIPEGGIYTILGPNGAGKSTLLRILNLIEPVQRGRFQMRGRDVELPAPVEDRRGIAMVFQRPIMFSGSVWHNITLGLRLRGRKPEGHVADLVEKLGLEELRHVPARDLSGGEAQRVALARALAIRPRVLLLDEPAANLDPYITAGIEHIIKKTGRETSTTVVLVTHNLFQAKRLADRIAILADGEILEQGLAVEVLESPTDPRTAAFLRGELVLKEKGQHT